MSNEEVIAWLKNQLAIAMDKSKKFECGFTSQETFFYRGRIQTFQEVLKHLEEAK